MFGDLDIDQGRAEVLAKKFHQTWSLGVQCSNDRLELLSEVVDACLEFPSRDFLQFVVAKEVGEFAQADLELDFAEGREGRIVIL